MGNGEWRKVNTEQVILHLLFDKLILLKLTDSTTTTETNFASKNRLFARFLDINVLSVEH